MQHGFVMIFFCKNVNISALFSFMDACHRTWMNILSAGGRNTFIYNIDCSFLHMMKQWRTSWNHCRRKSSKKYILGFLIQWCYQEAAES